MQADVPLFKTNSTSHSGLLVFFSPVQQGSGTSSSYGVGATPGYPPPPYIHPGIDLFPSGPPPVPPRHPTASATTPQSDSDKVSRAFVGFWLSVLYASKVPKQFAVCDV